MRSKYSERGTNNSGSRYTLNETGEQVQEAITNVREKNIYDPATRTQDGLMSKSDKIKLDDIDDDVELTIEEIENLINF